MKVRSFHKGSHVIIVIAVVVVLIGALGFVALKSISKQSGDSPATSIFGNTKDPNEPPLKIKHIGINLDKYNPKTGMAGDLKFTKKGIEQYGNIIFFEYGATAKANSAAQERKNPQPTFIVPLGTKIHSLVDGEVVKIETLYSKDVSVMVSDSKDSQWIYELEHVANPTVKVGDKVTAGQVVAEASPHDSQYHPGFGLYEIGILHAGNPPKHVCIFNYLDDSIKQKTFAAINDLYTSWETYMGDTSLYQQEKNPVPGCQTLDRVEG